MDQETRRVYNSKNCSANARLEFRGSVIVDSKTRDGKDYVCLDLVFSENVKIRLFNPEKSIRDRSIMSVLLSSLFEALGDDFSDVPPCRGGYHEFLSEVTETMNRRKYTMLYAKLTVNESGYIIMGEGRCFSTQPDLEYTDADLHFLTVDEPVKSSPKESFMPEFEDISFEVVEEPTQEVTVYSEVTTVNESTVEAIYGELMDAPIRHHKVPDDSILVGIDDIVFDGVSDALNDAVNTEEKLDFEPQSPTSDGVFEMLAGAVITSIQEPSDLDDIFSKPPEKSVIQQFNEAVLHRAAKQIDREIMAECPSDPEEYRMLEAIEYIPEVEEKPKKKAPVKVKIPKGQDPLRYIHGDPEGEDWGPRENKIINMNDLPS